MTKWFHSYMYNILAFRYITMRNRNETFKKMAVLTEETDNVRSCNKTLFCSLDKDSSIEIRKVIRDCTSKWRFHGFNRNQILSESSVGCYWLDVWPLTVSLSFVGCFGVADTKLDAFHTWRKFGLGTDINWLNRLQLTCSVASLVRLLVAVIHCRLDARFLVSNKVKRLNCVTNEFHVISPCRRLEPLNGTELILLEFSSGSWPTWTWFFLGKMQFLPLHPFICSSVSWRKDFSAAVNDFSMFCVSNGSEKHSGLGLTALIESN